MPYYVYTALNRDGSLVTGEGEFASLEDLYYSLQRDGYTLVKYSTKSRFLYRITLSRIKRTELAEFLHQLAFMVKSGVPLISALRDLEEEIKNKRLKYAVSKIIQGLMQGESLSEAVNRTGIFPKVVLALIQIGEASGNLDKTLEEASRHLYRIDEIISKTKRALLYPLLVILAMLGALAFWLFYVLPKLLDLFKEMGVKLPLPTLLLMKTVTFLNNIKIYILLNIIGFIIVFTFLYRYNKTQIYIDKLFLKIPLFGRVKRLNFLAFFFEHFSLLLRSGIDLLRLLKLMKESFYRIYYVKIVENIENSIIRGETISQAMKKEKIFRALDIRMVMVGETTGRLDDQMKMLADFYYNEVNNILDTLTKLLEPLVLVIAGLIFIIIIIALIGPIFELVSQLAKV